MKIIRIGLDVDGVISNFSEAVLRRAKFLGLEKEFPKSYQDIDTWDIAPRFLEVMEDVWKDEKFWLGIKPLVDDIPFTPNCYITKRHVPSSITEKWIAKCKFPKATVITVGCPTEKTKIVQDRELDVFVDDLHTTVRTMREVGVNALLMQAPYQRGHVEECAGLPTIKSLEEIFNYV